MSCGYVEDLAPCQNGKGRGLPQGCLI